jgi:quercetin dioxygenase-like cupin family protein
MSIPMNEFSDFAPLLVDSPTVSGFATTSWGEHARVRLRGAQTDGRLSMLVYECPAGFGPVRHLHREDDEIILMERGTIAVWTPRECRTAGPGDVVMLPKGVPHAWRSYGDERVRFQVIVTPGEFEPFFEHIVERNLTLADQAELVTVASEAGMDIIGPPLNDEEVAVIRAGGRV